MSEEKLENQSQAEQNSPDSDSQNPVCEPENQNISNDDDKSNKKEHGDTKDDAKCVENPLKKEFDALNDKFLRLAAEYDNYRKRTTKERTDAYNDAYSAAASMFLPLLDSLDRAIAFDPENEGVKMLAKLTLDIFEKMEIKEMETDQKPFNPEFHNAIMHEENPDMGENLIVQTLQKGYIMNGKVIRHAMVKVVN
ncbi:MAG: nucleotide exchange factor GrpE [Clostridia bacterium]